MRIRRPLLIQRVDELWPPTWYAGTNTFGAPTVTQSRDYAWRINSIEEAQAIVAMLRLDVGGVWSIVNDKFRM